MYICKNCGEVYDSDEVPTFEDDFGFETGVGFYSCPQTFVGKCRYCGGELEEAVQCEECGEWVCEDEAELDDSIRYLCKKCFKEWEEENEEAEMAEMKAKEEACHDTD